MKTVKNILETTNNISNIIPPQTLVIDALKKMIDVNLSYLVVMDGDKYKGIFSERDYSRKVALKGRTSDSTKVADVMTTDIPPVGITDTVETCMNMMNMYKTRYLLAFDDRQFIGVVTIHDLLRQVIFNKGEVFDTSIAKKLIDNEESGRIY